MVETQISFLHCFLSKLTVTIKYLINFHKMNLFWCDLKTISRNVWRNSHGSISIHWFFIIDTLRKPIYCKWTFWQRNESISKIRCKFWTIWWPCIAFSISKRYVCHHIFDKVNPMKRDRPGLIGLVPGDSLICPWSTLVRFKISAAILI